VEGGGQKEHRWILKMANHTIIMDEPSFGSLSHQLCGRRRHVLCFCGKRGGVWYVLGWSSRALSRPRFRRATGP